MPLNFPPTRTAFFHRGRPQQEGDNSEPERRGAVPVEPLTRGTSPMMPPQQQHRPYSQRPPLIPPQQNSRPPLIPPQQNSRPPLIPPQNSRPPMIPPQNSRPPMIPNQQNPHPPMIPNQQNSSQNPQTAAERFQQKNKGLPDGVRYEPLDEETMKILRARQASMNPDSNST